MSLFEIRMRNALSKRWKVRAAQGLLELRLRLAAVRQTLASLAVDKRISVFWQSRRSLAIMRTCKAMRDSVMTYPFAAKGAVAREFVKAQPLVQRMTASATSVVSNPFVQTSVRPAIAKLARRPELILLFLGLLAFFVFPNNLGFLTRVAYMAIFVLSLSLVLGQAGILTLGHAALFGSGAYAAGIFALHVSSNPILGLITGALAGALVAAASGLLLLRTHGLTLLMLTIAIAQILMETANKANRLTGGDDGLSGFKVDPVLGLFRFDLYGRTGYLYALAILVVAFFVLQRVVNSPFGLTCRGIRSDRGRMIALGCDVYMHQLATYTMGGLLAGLAGAVAAQTAGVVGLNSLGFFLSTEALVMLILGGSGRLVGALLGTVVFMTVHHVTAAINPFHWLFVIGFMLIATMLVLPQGLVELPQKIAQLLTRWRLP